MTLEEMQKAKADAEKTISEALNTFMRTTGLPVCEVQMEVIVHRTCGHPQEYIVGEVRLDVRL